jgi:hypothetical protein
MASGFVTNPVDYKYTSARNYGNDDHTVLEIDLNSWFVMRIVHGRDARASEGKVNDRSAFCSYPI